MIKITGKGDFKNTYGFLNRILNHTIFDDLDRYGQRGVDALAAATPVASGLSANSWNYRVIKNRRDPGIEWYNTNISEGSNIVVLLQYGHATGTGGYVPGRDFINPALKPIFDEITNDLWKKVIQ